MPPTRTAPKGKVSDNGTTSLFLDDTDQLFTADQYRPLIVAYNNGAAVRLGDVAEVEMRYRTGATWADQWQTGHYAGDFPAAGGEHHRHRGPCAGDYSLTCRPRFRLR